MTDASGLADEPFRRAWQSAVLRLASYGIEPTDEDNSLSVELASQALIELYGPNLRPDLPIDLFLECVAMGVAVRSNRQEPQLQPSEVSVFLDALIKLQNCLWRRDCW
jgi:hypothetical protein